MDASTTASATVSPITTASVVVPVGIEYFKNFFVQYLLSPAVVGGIIWFGMSRSIKIGEIKKDFETIKNDVGDLKTKSGSIVTNITVIKTHLVDKAGLSANLFHAMSPISLTPTGKILINEIAFDGFVTENEEEILNTFVANGVDNLLKVDELSEVVVDEFHKDGKLPSYENEAFTRGFSLEVVLRACSLYLRDYIAKKLSITS